MDSKHYIMGLIGFVYVFFEVENLNFNKYLKVYLFNSFIIDFIEGLSVIQYHTRRNIHLFTVFELNLRLNIQMQCKCLDTFRTF
jgi:hypothetical protein